MCNLELPLLLQDTSHPSFLLSRSAFRGTILPTKTASSKLELTRQQPAEGEVVIRFRLWYGPCASTQTCQDLIPLRDVESAILLERQDRPWWSCCSAQFPQCLSGPCRDWGIQDGDSFVVSGSLPQLGNWQQDQPLLLSEAQMPFWETEVHMCWAFD